MVRSGHFSSTKPGANTITLIRESSEVQESVSASDRRVTFLPRGSGHHISYQQQLFQFLEFNYSFTSQICMWTYKG